VKLDISKAHRVAVAQLMRPVDALAVDEGAIGARRVLQKDLRIATDEQGMIPRNGGALDDDIIIMAGAEGIIALVKAVAARRGFRVVEIAIKGVIGDLRAGGQHKSGACFAILSVLAFGAPRVAGRGFEDRVGALKARLDHGE